ncbi:glycylpeptide N-tetradecanoyltransferase [Fistulifera solaris]|uniref:Glycylpeptide N-tetradecanoyltransferase n=1 Tax=Fistulifera solaris TaxID=1519565 RepID=A0A1Z5JKD2_FISSO|nr:glycylpeptide N-tetradecanoyltransferase [Fistulifera solaris]|eukprot:GAX14312.1 glycylpeptide N-tetradecanoyltransferase [Fistulifera solaris]
MTDSGDNNDEKEKQLSPAESAIIEMLKQQNISAQPISTQQGDSSPQHAFWDSQPMPHGSRDEHQEGPIQPNKPTEEIRQEPYAMPAGFEWSNVNVEDDAERLELYNLLANNYVEDDDALFRFDYSHEFLLWALTPPGFRADFLFGVRSTSSKKLVAFISAVPARVKIYDREVEVVEINFLCIHKKLRSKRLAPVLIKEITRRVNLTGVFQAVYTAGTVLPVPVASCRYYHRSLNPKKLVNVGFSRLGSRMTMARLQKLYKLPEAPSTKGLRPMEKKDVEGVHTLLNTYLEKFKIKILFSKDEIAHWLLPRKNVIDTYVVESPNGEITDMLSFYHLPSTILNQDDTLYAAYSYYNVATSMDLLELMREALILAKSKGTDVFNALNLMDNQSIMEPLKFGMGDGNLQYYVYNWACPEMSSDSVGIVLL